MDEETKRSLLVRDRVEELEERIDAMEKRYASHVIHLPTVMRPAQGGDYLRVDDVFPLGPDGKRHPTREEIEEYRHGLSDHPVEKMLLALATVAPKEEP